MAKSMTSNELIDWMRENKTPVTRDNYIGLEYGSVIPDPWTAEHEQELPVELQDWSKFTLIDGQMVYQG